jgi:hypothetical protein
MTVLHSHSHYGNARCALLVSLNGLGLSLRNERVPIDPSSRRPVELYLDLRRWLVLAHPEHSAGRLGFDLTHHRATKGDGEDHGCEIDQDGFAQHTRASPEASSPSVRATTALGNCTLRPRENLMPPAHPAFDAPGPSAGPSRRASVPLTCKNKPSGAQTASPKDARTMISAAQCRCARTLLRWSVSKLASAASISESAIDDFELERRQPTAIVTEAIRRAFEDVGVVFLPQDDVQLRSDASPVR